MSFIYVDPVNAELIFYFKQLEKLNHFLVDNGPIWMLHGLISYKFCPFKNVRDVYVCLHWLSSSSAYWINSKWGTPSFFWVNIKWYSMLTNSTWTETPSQQGQRRMHQYKWRLNHSALPQLMWSLTLCLLRGRESLKVDSVHGEWDSMSRESLN